MILFLSAHELYETKRRLLRREVNQTRDGTNPPLPCAPGLPASERSQALSPVSPLWKAH